MLLAAAWHTDPAVEGYTDLVDTAGDKLFRSAAARGAEASFDPGSMSYDINPGWESSQFSIIFQ